MLNICLEIKLVLVMISVRLAVKEWIKAAKAPSKFVIKAQT